MLFVLSLTSSVAVADESVGLRDVVKVAVTRNVAMRNAEADLEIAEGVVIQWQGLDDMVLGANGTWTSQRQAVVDGVGFQQQPELDSLHLEASLTKPFGTGGSLGLKLSEDYTRALIVFQIMGVNAEQEFTSHRQVAQLTLTQPLLHGFGYDVSRAQRRKSVAQLDAAALDRENAASNALRDVVGAYWELAYAAQELAIRRQSLALAQEQLRITQARVDAGAASSTDLAAVQQGIATREEDVILAGQVLRQRALELRQAAGMDIAADQIALAAADPLVVQPVDYALAEIMSATIAHNPQIAALRARGKAARIDVEVGENGMLPQLDLNAQFGPTGIGTDFGDATSALLTFKDWSVLAGLTFTLPVGRNNARGLLMQARGQLHKIKVSEADVTAQIQVAVARDLDLVASARQRIKLDGDAVKYAQINLDAEKARFGVGRTTNFEVLKRQEELAQSELRQARATADYLKAVAVLQALTGEILPTYGVKLARNDG